MLKWIGRDVFEPRVVLLFFECGELLGEGDHIGTFVIGRDGIELFFESPVVNKTNAAELFGKMGFLFEGRIDAVFVANFFHGEPTEVSLFFCRSYLQTLSYHVTRLHKRRTAFPPLPERRGLRA